MANICFSIPGNIKQQMLPFVLNPHATINQNVSGSTSLKRDDPNYAPMSAGLKTGGPQWFSFKNMKQIPASGFGKLQICPSTLTNINFGNYFGKDISYKLLYGRNPDGSPTNKGITLDDVFQSVPSIQIREFLPDTRLDQCINIFEDILKELWNSGKQVIGGLGSTMKGFFNGDASWTARFAEFGSVLGSAFDFVVGNSDVNFIVDKNGDFRFADKNNYGLYDGIYDKSSGSNDINMKIVDFPFLMYYQLQSCVTANIYEIPGMLDNKNILTGNGAAGWKGGKGFGAAALGDGILGKLPFIKKVVDNVLGNVQINWMPLWDPKDGSSAQHPKLTVKFDLFNDTADAAMQNFIFVNTLVPNNMYIQYGMFQHSSPLYDVKIAGLERLYACSGQFTVNYGGILRNMPESWIDTLVDKHSNQMYTKLNGGRVNPDELKRRIKANNLIKVPDIYSVQMEFDSLLPNNFNSYLFNYTHNLDMQQTHLDKGIYQSSAFAPDTVVNALKDFTEYMKAKTGEAVSRIDTYDAYMKAEKEQKQEAKKRQEAAERAQPKKGSAVVTR